MAYATNSLNLQIPRVGGGEDVGSLSAAQYVYRSADPVLTVIAAGYIDDGVDKGMQVNDYVVVIDDNLGLIDLCIVTVVAANGDVTLVNGT
jgi:hypothetical protein